MFSVKVRAGNGERLCVAEAHVSKCAASALDMTYVGLWQEKVLYIITHRRPLIAVISKFYVRLKMPNAPV